MYWHTRKTKEKKRINQYIHKKRYFMKLFCYYYNHPLKELNKTPQRYNIYIVEKK